MVIKHVALIKQKVSEMKEIPMFPTINAVAQSSVEKVTTTLNNRVLEDIVSGSMLAYPHVKHEQLFFFL